MVNAVDSGAPCPTRHLRKRKFIEDVKKLSASHAGGSEVACVASFVIHFSKVDFRKIGHHDMQEVRQLMGIAAIEWHHNAIEATNDKVLEAFIY